MVALKEVKSAARRRKPFLLGDFGPERVKVIPLPHETLTLSLWSLVWDQLKSLVAQW